MARAADSRQPCFQWARTTTTLEGGGAVAPGASSGSRWQSAMRAMSWLSTASCALSAALSACEHHQPELNASPSTC
jgi:hypothetical protein